MAQKRRIAIQDLKTSMSVAVTLAGYNRRIECPQDFALYPRNPKTNLRSEIKFLWRDEQHKYSNKMVKMRSRRVQLVNLTKASPCRFFETWSLCDIFCESIPQANELRTALALE